jgi:hypothetical protein
MSTVFPLPSEFIVPQDGDKKQDCEMKAARRWIDHFGDTCKQYNPIYLGDDLYAKQPICLDIINHSSSFIFTCKDASHKTLTEFRKGLAPSYLMRTRGIGSQKRDYHYRWIEDLPMRDGKDSLNVNWLDIEIANSKGKITYHTSFITNIKPTRENIVELIKCGRTRWKIENETFNVLKNNGYHLEHNFGHGQDTLSSVLVVLNLLTFLMHNACDAVEILWKEARKQEGARNRLFVHLWTISTYRIFPSWRDLLISIIRRVLPP